jgi:O-antigen ligase
VKIALMPINYSYIGVIFDQPFYYHGHLRWSYGWATPNFAGAFLATIEPAIWMAAGLIYNKSRYKASRGFQFAAELVFWFLLARTYSRGSIVAAFSARAAWQAVQGELTAIKTWAGYLVAPLVCILSSGFGGRIYNTVATADPSVGHRLELWVEGLRMLAASPWTGWGSGNSGIMYMNWYEPPGHTEHFTAMVNSYLSLAVDYGLPAFCLVMFVSGFLICGGMSAAKSAAEAKRASPALALGAATSACVAWLVANVFSNLWVVPSLWIVPGAAVCAIGGCRENWKTLWLGKIFPWAFLSISAGLFLFFAGRALEWRSPVAVRHSGSDIVVLEARINSAENKRLPAIDLWPDPLVLGEVPGRQLRAWLQQSDGPECLTVYKRPEAIMVKEKTGQGDRILVLVGRQAARLKLIQIRPSDRIILVHPMQLNREDLLPLRGHRAVVVLPEIDQGGTNDATKNEAGALGAKVLFSPSVGVELRPIWPGIMKEAIATATDPSR